MIFYLTKVGINDDKKKRVIFILNILLNKKHIKKLVIFHNNIFLNI
jgi:hypothetical protein